MELPEELMTMILLKLPAKSLFRCKCVQKSWPSLINSPYFIRLHLSSINKNDCFLVRRFIEKQQQNVLSMHSYETLDEDLGSQISIPFSVVGDPELCGSCDGLVCLACHEQEQIFICNPTIREWRSLVFPPPLSNKSGFQIVSVAFGSDPNTGQYKVVMIGEPYDINDKYTDCEAWLYDFSSDSWGERATVFPYEFDNSPCAVSLNGAFHWSPWRDSKNIITFHMSNEVTGFIPLPDFVVNAYQTKLELELFVSTKSHMNSFGTHLSKFHMNSFGTDDI